MASLQFGLDKATLGLRGRGEEVTVVKRLSRRLGLNIPCMLRLAIVRIVVGPG